MCLCTYSGINLNNLPSFLYIQVVHIYSSSAKTLTQLSNTWLFKNVLWAATNSCLSIQEQTECFCRRVSPYSNQITAGLRKRIHSILALFPSPYKSQIGTSTVMPQAHVTCLHGTLQNSYWWCMVHTGVLFKLQVRCLKRLLLLLPLCPSTPRDAKPPCAVTS